MTDPSSVIWARQETRAREAEASRKRMYMFENKQIFEQLPGAIRSALSTLQHLDWPDDEAHGFKWIKVGDEVIAGWRVAESRTGYIGDNYITFSHTMYLLADGRLRGPHTEHDIYSPDFGTETLQNIMAGLQRIFTSRYG